MKLTLKWNGKSGDGKRSFVVADQNDGWRDLRIEVDTDDCDREAALAKMQEVIDRCNQADREAGCEHGEPDQPAVTAVCVCGSTRISRRTDVGFDIWPGGEERQHEDHCLDCGATRLVCDWIEGLGGLQGHGKAGTSCGEWMTRDSRIENERRGEVAERTSNRIRAVAGEDQEKTIAERIYLSLWENPGYLPDPVADAFRNAMVETAMEICHECGTEDATVAFCAEAIAEWMRLDAPKNAERERRASSWVAFMDDGEQAFPVCTAETETAAREEGRRIAGEKNAHFISVRKVPNDKPRRIPGEGKTVTATQSSATDGRPRCPECGRIVVMPRTSISDTSSNNSGPDPEVWCSMGHWVGRLSECR